MFKFHNLIFFSLSEIFKSVKSVKEPYLIKKELNAKWIDRIIVLKNLFYLTTLMYKQLKITDRHYV